MMGVRKAHDVEILTGWYIINSNSILTDYTDIYADVLRRVIEDRIFYNFLILI